MTADEEKPDTGAEPPDDGSQAGQQPEHQSEEQAGEAGEGHAVPSEDAAEIAASAEDAALEAFEEAQEAGAELNAPEQAAVAPGGEGHAVPTEEAMEVAAVAEDAPLEEAEDHAAEEAAAGEEEDEREPAAAGPSVPGAHLEVDIVPEGVDPLGRGETYVDPYALEEAEQGEESVSEETEEEEETLAEPISTAAIDLASGARYRATGKRKTAIARVTLRPGTGTYLINGRPLEIHFPRLTLQRNIRQPLETVGYQERMDVVARLHGGGISAQAGALRHGVSRALLEADPNLRGELKRRGFLTRDPRVKERKKAGLKKARKRPQFSKR
jgi:small subunit ribosomal protein S9